ncbi:MAG: OadG family protein, partial [Anaerolineae bacterium]
MMIGQDVGELLGRGLVMTAVGMGLVFGALALLWGAIALLGRVFKPEAAGAGHQVSVSVTAATPA